MDNIFFLERSPCLCGIILFLGSKKTEAASEAPCETEHSWWSLDDEDHSLLTCVVYVKTVLDEDFTISSPRNNSTLGFIILEGNSVKFVPTNFFNVLPNLKALRISDCSVETINENHFKSLSKLEYLYLDNNLIDNVASNAFTDLVNLKVLNLSSNRISALDENTFTTLQALEELYLSDNQIQFLHPKLFDSLYYCVYIVDDMVFGDPTLKIIDLRDNLCINKIYVSGGLFRYCSDLEKYLGRKCGKSSAQEKLKTAVANIEMKLSYESEKAKTVQKEMNELKRVTKNILSPIFLLCITLFFVVLILVVVYPPSRVFRHYTAEV